MPTLTAFGILCLVMCIYLYIRMQDVVPAETKYVGCDGIDAYVDCIPGRPSRVHIQAKYVHTHTHTHTHTHSIPGRARVTTQATYVDTHTHTHTLARSHARAHTHTHRRRARTRQAAGAGGASRNEARVNGTGAPLTGQEFLKRPLHSGFTIYTRALTDENVCQVRARGQWFALGQHQTRGHAASRLSSAPQPLGFGIWALGFRV